MLFSSISKLGAIAMKRRKASDTHENHLYILNVTGKLVVWQKRKFVYNDTDLVHVGIFFPPVGCRTGHKS